MHELEMLCSNASEIELLSILNKRSCIDMQTDVIGWKSKEVEQSSVHYIKDDFLGQNEKKPDKTQPMNW